MALKADVDGADLEFVQQSIGTYRNLQPADRRAPLLVIQALPIGMQRHCSWWPYPKADVWHRTTLRLPPPRRPDRDVVTVYGLSFLHFEDEPSVPDRSLKTLAEAAAVVTGSEFSAGELARYVDRDRIHVIPPGVDEVFRSAVPLSRAEREQAALPNRFVVHGGGATERRNLRGLANAWQRIRADHPDVGLVLLGAPDSRRSELFGRLDGVFSVGAMSDSVRARVIASAEVAVVPSFYEAFGMHAVEAMAAGTPLVAATGSSLPEVCGEAAVMVEPVARAITDGVCRVLADPELADTLRTAGRERARAYTWAEVARAHVELYRSLAL